MMGTAIRYTEADWREFKTFLRDDVNWLHFFDKQGITLSCGLSSEQADMINPHFTEVRETLETLGVNYGFNAEIVIRFDQIEDTEEAS